jgi:ribosomal protein L37AE/L43A
MICENCNKVILKPIQESKDDYWKCSYCDSYHKGFPYECPLLSMKREIRELYHTSSSFRDFKTQIFFMLESFIKMK